MEAALAAAGRDFFVILLSEIFPAKLELFSKDVDAWVQASHVNGGGIGVYGVYGVRGVCAAVCGVRGVCGVCV